jgi:linoleoyl-CoA desaturase
VTASTMKFRNSGAFTSEVRSEVDRFLALRPELLPRARRELAVKAATAVLLIVGSYLSLLLFHPGLELVGVALLGLVLGAILAGFCVQHDANHLATFTSQRWNHLLAWVFSDVCLGFGSHMWQTKHNVAHHTYTNVAGYDPDAEQTPLLKLAPSQPGRAWYRWQIVYAWPLYLLMGFRMQFMADVVGFSQGRIGRSPLRFPRGWPGVGVFAGKALFLSWTFLVPILLGFPWWGVLVCYFVVVATLSLVMTIVFQLAHCVTEATYATPEQLTVAGERTEWMIYQVQSTVDFSPRNRLLSWWLGGLNFQVIHHLFPKLPHPLYRQLAPIVEEVCERHGLTYQAHPSIWSAFGSHLRHLWQMGKLGQPLELEMG